MSGNRLTARETAAALRGMDNVLLLTHVRPDGDTIGCAAALCQALRDTGKTAYLLYNPEITATYAPCAAPYWAPEGFAPEHVVSTDIAALNNVLAVRYIDADERGALEQSVVAPEAE